jgi:hypothetical protein
MLRLWRERPYRIHIDKYLRLSPDLRRDLALQRTVATFVPTLSQK